VSLLLASTRRCCAALMLAWSVWAASLAAGAVKEVAEPYGHFTISIPADWEVQVGPGFASAYAPDMLANIGISMERNGILTAQQRAQEEVKSTQETARDVKKSVPAARFEITQGTTRVAGRPAYCVHEEIDMGQGGPPGCSTDWVYFETGQGVVSIVVCIQKRAPAAVAEAARRIVPSLKLGGGPPQPQAEPRPAAGALKTVSEPAGLFSLSIPADWQAQQVAGFVTASAPGMHATVMVRAEPRGAATPAQRTEAEIQKLRAAAQVGGVSDAQLFETRPSYGTTTVAGRRAVSVHYVESMFHQSEDWICFDTDRLAVTVHLTLGKDAAPPVQEAARQVLASLKLGAVAAAPPAPATPP